MFNFIKDLQGEVTISGDEFECRFCNQDASIIYVHDYMGELIWEGCTNCLIAKLNNTDGQFKSLQKKLDQAINRKDVDCMCDNVSLGCKCGASIREKYLKKINYFPLF